MGDCDRPCDGCSGCEGHPRHVGGAVGGADGEVELARRQPDAEDHQEK